MELIPKWIRDGRKRRLNDSITNGRERMAEAERKHIERRTLVGFALK